MRAEPGYEQLGASLASELGDQLRRDGIRQIQAIVDDHDEPTQHLLTLGGFRRVTRVQQLWLDVQHRPRLRAHVEDISWQPARELAPEALSGLIDETFVETLDCPLINGLRSPEEVLTGFLNGQDYQSAVHHWWILRDADHVAGCMLLCQHSPELVELAYMGLRVEARGKGLGSVLIEKSLEVADKLAARMMIVGVDEQNWPALQAYQRHDFHSHGCKAVYFRDIDLQHAARRAA